MVAELEHAGEGPEADGRDEHQGEHDSFTARRTSIIRRAGSRRRDGLRLRAPRDPSGTAIATASSVPESAMHTVTTHCQAYSPTLANDG